MPKGTQGRELTEREKLEVDVRSVRASLHGRKDILASCIRALDDARKAVIRAEKSVEQWSDDLAAAEKALKDYDRVPEGKAALYPVEND